MPFVGRCNVEETSKIGGTCLYDENAMDRGNFHLSEPRCKEFSQNGLLGLLRRALTAAHAAIVRWTLPKILPDKRIALICQSADRWLANFLILIVSGSISGHTTGSSAKSDLAAFRMGWRSSSRISASSSFRSFNPILTYNPYIPLPWLYCYIAFLASTSVKAAKFAEKGDYRELPRLTATQNLNESLEKRESRTWPKARKLSTSRPVGGPLGAHVTRYQTPAAFITPSRAKLSTF
ncbi:hypothetical protein B0H13DRAFT_1867953 [Mycena leptocephala]|nr:hypothetical protein B0H13DRAFT_1867953 [Mycena leptocephala]